MLGTGFWQVLRGVRQGDPISPLLFVIAMKHVMASVQVSWQEKGFGTEVGKNDDSHRLTHVAFADDLTLVTTSWASMQQMLVDVQEALASFGLTLHPEKCKLQTNNPTVPAGLRNVRDGFPVEIVPPSDGFMLLGCRFCWGNLMANEVQHRIAGAWAKFRSLKRMLLHPDGTLKKRLQLFDATVGSCMLWCSESWCLPKDHKTACRRAQHAMLENIVAPNTAPGEEWVD